ncbi:MAG TPA: CehA/McbA family metallohydrolase [Bryobacteraceae bacterium]|nr:CehA/McbA family metallohydrolase [Bryobacteraceae bacterium]
MSNRTRRRFLGTVGSGVPTLSLVSQAAGGMVFGQEGGASGRTSPKFTPVDLSRFFNAGPAGFGPRDRARRLSGPSRADGLIRMPTGEQRFRGIPFRLGPEGAAGSSWIWLSTQPGRAVSEVEIPLSNKAGFICFAHFCDWDPHETPDFDAVTVEQVGQTLAEAVLIYSGGGEAAFPIRRRIEVNAPSITWGFPGYACVSHYQDSARKSRNELDEVGDWGWFRLQSDVLEGNYTVDASTGAPKPSLWLFALPNPHPDRRLSALRLRAAGQDPLLVCGVTLFHGRQHPLRYERLTLYRLTLPDASGQWSTEVDLGVVARSYHLGKFDPQEWLDAPDAGLGSRTTAVDTRHLYIEVTASSEATLLLRDGRGGRQFEFALGQVTAGKEMPGTPAGSRIEILETAKTWIHGSVADAATGRPTPVRLAFRSSDGRYIPPYGHRTEVDAGTFKDWGADLKLADTCYAYVDGTFQIELPVGDVYVEISKGFEYEPIRQRLAIQAGQRELKLEIARTLDFRSRGWVTADTHVHFLSPSTAVLEGQAEGLNIVNLLATQWGDLFTNVGDLSQGPLASSDGEMVVWMGTENRQHILGHLAVLGKSVFPMAAGGPRESYHGDPVWDTLAGWSDAAREQGGLAVSVHFPYPAGEQAADIVLGKTDAVELFPDTGLRLQHWYRALSCGYRLPVVGGTDKMGAGTAVGANRTYAQMGVEPLNSTSWARAVRGGNTFMTTGPLLLFEADGRVPGQEIRLGQGGGTIEVLAHARSVRPIHRVDVVWNGRVVASRQNREGARDITLKERIQVPGPGWLAARCSSTLRPRIMAHTSPVYAQVPGQEVFSKTAAAYMLTQVEAVQTWVETLATRPDPERFEKIRKVFADARTILHRRLHEHGVKH